jgi:hypothetical protein
VDQIDERRRWPQRVLEVVRVGDDDLLDIDDVRDEREVEEEEPDEVPVELALGQREGWSWADILGQAPSEGRAVR